jgi:alanine dehydrogenase
MLVLTREHLEQLLDPHALIGALATAMADLSAGRASVPKRSIARVGTGGLLAAMPAYLPGLHVLAAKLVLVFAGNASRGLETHQALMAAFDPATGVPVAIMDGASITAMRTAAGSALATRLCARDDARVLAIIGTGVQARAHARMVPRVRAIRDMVVAGHTPDKVKLFAAEIGATAVSNCADAVTAADIICTCTSATEPVIRREWLTPGVHVNAVGFAPGPELEPAAFRGARVVVESRDAAVGQFPDGAVDITRAIQEQLLSIEDVSEVGEIVQGLRPGRTARDEITIYRSVGVAAQDAAAVGLVLEAARRQGVGTEVAL